MSFQFGEKPDSRTGSSSEHNRKYFACGTTDGDYVLAYADAMIEQAIVTLNGTLYRQPITIDSWKGPYCELSVTFSKQQQSENKVGSLKWNYDTTGGTVNIKAALEHMASYPAGAKEHGGAIGVNKDEVEGCEVVIPAMKFTVTYTHPRGFISLDRAFQHGDYTGAVNSNTFFTRPAGSFLFLGATGSDGSDADAEVTYQFAYSKNLQNKIISGITVTEKDGWDYAWISFKPDTNNGGAVRVPQAVHVERVYERTNFATLFGFS